jgi:integrase/recombinase XerD
VRVLKRRELKEELPTPKRHRRLPTVLSPTVLSPDEVRQLIAGAKNLYHRTMLMTLYGAADTGVSSGSFDGTINPSH